MNRNLQIALSNLRNIAGLDPDEPLQLEGSLDRYPEMPVSGALGVVLAERPDYRALQGERSLREIEIAANRAEFYPSLTGSLRWRRSDRIRSTLPMVSCSSRAISADDLPRSASE